MSAAIVVDKAYKTYKNLNSPLWQRGSSSNRCAAAGRAHRLGSALDKGSSRNSGLLEQLPVVVAIDRVSFTVDEGQIFGLIGPNGSGKSTLIRLLATLLPLDDGTIQIFNYDAARQPLKIQRLVNPLAAEASFFKKLSPLDNLIHDGRQAGLSEAETRRQVMEILTCLGMHERFVHSAMEDISSGMQQMVVLAQAILSRPRLLLLDEPSSGLDPFARRQMHMLLANLSQHCGTTIVFATQDIDEADQLCDKIAILDHGQIVALGTPEELKGSSSASLEDAFVDLIQHQSLPFEAEFAR